MAFPSASASKNCQTAFTFMNFAASALTSSTRLCNSSAFGSLAARHPTALELHNLVEDVKAEAAKFMKVKAVWQFFDAEAEGNAIKLSAVSGQPSATNPQSGSP